MKPMKNVLKSLMEGQQLDADGMSKVAAIFSLAYNSTQFHRLQREYDLRNNVLATMPMNTPLRVCEIQEQGQMRVTVQKLTGVLRALVWAGVVVREVCGEEEITVEQFDGWTEFPLRYKTKNITIKVPIAKYKRVL
jgi:hypothetical protein